MQDLSRELYVKTKELGIAALCLSRGCISLSMVSRLEDTHLGRIKFSIDVGCLKYLK